MILQTIRASFPEATRTMEEDILIGDSCLALTDKEREVIENLNFENYQYNSLQRTEISTRVTSAIYKAQLVGTTTGVAIGVLGGGTIIWKTSNSLPVTALTGAAASVTGGVFGYYAGKKLGCMRIVREIEGSTEYHKWKNEKYQTVIFPALLRYTDPRQWEEFQLVCPITLDFMLEPVKASDGHIYEKSAILAHLAAWQQRRDSLDRRLLDEEGQIQFLLASSPFRVAHITADTLEPIRNYYENFFKELVNDYNSRVLEQRAIVNVAQEESGPLTEQATKIVKLYSMTQRERNRIQNRMRIALEDLLLSEEEMEISYELLNAAAKLPRELQLPQ